MENWLTHLLNPRIDFRIYEFLSDGVPIVMFEVQPALNIPVRFKGEAYIRIGSYKKKLKEHPEKERALWTSFPKRPFEKGIAKGNVTTESVLTLIDYPKFFELIGQRLPDNRIGILDWLTKEKIIIKKSEERYDITNLGAILFAKAISEFESLDRKAIRVVIYKGKNRISTIKEEDGIKGYAVGFGGLIQYIQNRNHPL